VSKQDKIAASVGGVLIVVVGTIAVLALTHNYVNTRPSQNRTASRLASVTTAFDPLTQYLGPCQLVVTPPAPNQCQAAAGHVVAFLGSLVNGNLFKAWKAANPGEYQRLSAHLANPMCSVAPVGQPQDMVTMTGAAFSAAVSIYACVEGSPPALVWPAPNPPPVAGAKDKTPPTPPGPVTITPGP
jgi:hypothetical protein